MACGLLAACLADVALAQDIQLTLKADDTTYAQGEPIKLSYEVLWLGTNDGVIFEPSTAFPTLEISYLNRFPIEMVELRSVTLNAAPSRHERRTFAPTMRLESQAVQVNSRAGVQFLDGRFGYYRFDRPGTYIVRAVFREAFGWKLYDGQQEDIRSNAIVIEILPASSSN